MVGQRIRYYRKTKGLTQEELAQGICSVSYLSKIEKGDAKSSEEVINLLCDRLGISPEEVDNNEILEMLNEWNMMMVNRRFEEATEYYPALHEKMKNVSNPEILIRFDLFLTRYYLVTDQLKEAQGKLNSLNQIQEQFSAELEFYFFQVTAMYNFFLNKYNEALDSIKKCEALFRKVNIKESEEAVLYYQIALYYGQLYRITLVNYYAYKAISIFDKEYNYSRSADCHILLAINNRRVRNYEQAEYHLNHALKYSKAFNDKSTTAIIFHNLGYVSSCKKESKKAIEYILKSYKLKQELNDINIQLITTIYLAAKEYFNIGDFTKSLEWINKGYEIIKNDDFVNNEYFYHLKILEFQIQYANQNTSKELEEFLSKEAIPYFDKLNTTEYLAANAELLADLYFDQGQYKKASHYYRISNNARKHIL
ncbi:helix-turn-helix transcriptional regulator [Fictibacillus nanhaiensis]|uniref:helix-turn-helix transcriptional regulator n=1 Tax=Fictibacillus nanhaiensis TaxID=742169 RepID=UPI002E1F595E|nr:helix-turn-helix transcriptional regulator [Fictibacillus nanhaiensis]